VQFAVTVPHHVYEMFAPFSIVAISGYWTAPDVSVPLLEAPTKPMPAGTVSYMLTLNAVSRAVYHFTNVCEPDAAPPPGVPFIMPAEPAVWGAAV
jgi:hypothetical protein